MERDYTQEVIPGQVLSQKQIELFAYEIAQVMMIWDISRGDRIKIAKQIVTDFEKETN